MPADEAQPLLAKHKDANQVNCQACSPKTILSITRRVMALIDKLLPLQVEDDEIRSPTSSIITSPVIKAFSSCAGDFSDVVPYCLLQARRKYRALAFADPSNYDENINKRTACEVLARKIVQNLPAERQHIVLSTRYKIIESDGDESMEASALELAVDQHCPFFLSSSEAQKVVFGLWQGHLISMPDWRGYLSYTPWREATKGGFLRHYDPARMAVPRYQNIFRISLWALFLICYSIAIQTPERAFGPEDIVLYVQLAGYTLEDLIRLYKIQSLSVISFWTIVNFCIYSILYVALGFRLADRAAGDADNQARYRLKSFQILSCAAPLIWMKLLTIFDLFSTFGTLQIVLSRMLKESAVFFVFLMVCAAGFLQSLTGLDIADSSRDSTETVVHALLQGLLGSPTFDKFEKGSDVSYPYGQIVYYAWAILTIILLLNILIALFGSAYSQIVEEEPIAQFMVFFAGKTIGAVRAPDDFVYPAPFNLVELLIIPFEFFLSKQAYASLNRAIMSALFVAPLSVIALFESNYLSKVFERDEDRLFLGTSPEDEDDEVEACQNPEPEEPEENQVPGYDPPKICTKTFEDLIKCFPDLDKSASTMILDEIRKLRAELKVVADKQGIELPKEDVKREYEKVKKDADDNNGQEDVQ